MQIYSYSKSSPNSMRIPKRVFDGQQCLTFSAHMTGRHMGSLEVVRMMSEGGEEMLYERIGEHQQGQWFTESLTTTVNADDEGVRTCKSTGALCIAYTCMYQSCC